jgi:hypothetical protein
VYQLFQVMHRSSLAKNDVGMQVGAAASGLTSPPTLNFFSPITQLRALCSAMQCNAISKSNSNVTVHKSMANLLLFRILSPYFQNMKGNGIMISAMKPSNELPQPSPSAAYIFGPAKGSNPPSVDRNRVFAAVTEAA